MSQAQLAGTEISTAYLSRLESGERPPTPRVLSYLCTRLEVAPSAFHGSSGSILTQTLATVVTLGESAENARLLEDALQQDDEGDAALRWQAHWLLARSYRARGESERELSTLQELTRLSDGVGVPDLQARSRVGLARRLRDSGELALAHVSATEALALAERHQLLTRDVVEALMTVISVEAESGRLHEARSRADRLVEALAADVPVQLQVEALWTAATVRVRQVDRTGAVSLLQRALYLLPSNEDPLLWMRLRLAATSLYLQMDPRDTAQARARLAEARVAAELVGMPLHRREVLFLQCQLAFHEGRYDEAREFSDQVGAGTKGMGLREQVRLDILRNQLAIIDGDRASAVVAMERIAKKAQESSNVELSAEVWRALAEALAVQGRTAPSG